MSQAIKCLILLAVVALFFVTEIIPLAVTVTAACLLPVALGICASAGIPASRQMMPLAFTCGWGVYHHSGRYYS